MQTDAADFVAPLFIDRSHDDSFSVSAPAPFAGLLAADVNFVNLDTVGKPFTVVADGASPELKWITRIKNIQGIWRMMIQFIPE